MTHVLCLPTCFSDLLWTGTADWSHDRQDRGSESPSAAEIEIRRRLGGGCSPNAPEAGCARVWLLLQQGGFICWLPESRRVKVHFQAQEHHLSCRHGDRSAPHPRVPGGKCACVPETLLQDGWRLSARCSARHPAPQPTYVHTLAACVHYQQRRGNLMNDL